MIKRGANVNCKGEGASRPMREAAFIGQSDFAEARREYQCESDNGKTPLGAALEYKCDEVAAFLRKHGGKE